MELSFQESSLLKLIEYHITQINDDAKVLDSKSKDNINIITVVVALGNLLSLSANPSQQRVLVMLGVLIIYGVILYLWFRTVSPKSWRISLKPTWEEAMRVLQKSDRDYYLWLVSTHLETIEHNNGLLRRKECNVRLSSILVVIDIAFIFLATLV